jgi:N-acyl-D-aspartate/D-glutamate deacylase/D-alanyl-D-alanine dipeptidase
MLAKLRISAAKAGAPTVALLLPLIIASAQQTLDPLFPGPKPQDAPAEWKQLVGIYLDEHAKQSFILLEQDGRLYWRDDKGKSQPISVAYGHIFPPSEGKSIVGHSIERNEAGNATAFCYLNFCYTRTDAGSDPSRSYRVKPSRPVDELRREALIAKPPEENGAFAKPDLVELAPLDPSIHLDIRYATSNDFLGAPVYSQARAFVQRPTAESLLRVQQKLKPLGYGLLIHDAYRPWYVTKMFWDATPAEGKIFVADPAQGSRHNRGCAVDLTLYDLSTGEPVEMPGTYDEMSPRSFPDYPGGTSLQRWHRDLLRRAMESEGFSVYEAEWWHFDYEDWKQYPILNVPFEKLDSRKSRGSAEASFDLIIRNGHILDGTGNPWYAADVGIKGDRIAAISDLRDKQATQEIYAKGRIVSPGFVDMLGQSELSLLIDNRSMSKLSQGITTEITGEGGSVAPQNEKTIAPQKPFLEQYKLIIDWTTLDGYFRHLEKQGTPLNIGTYVGSAQVREAVIGDDNRAPTPAELEQMKSLVEQAMKDGALGVSSALIYPPNIFAKTDELIALAQVASKYGGLYATHMRSEGASEMPALAEAIRIGREANLPVEVFHLKVSGKPRWGTMKNVVAAIQNARDSGLDIAADMYPYTAGATALASALPPWVADGGVQKLLERLKDPDVRARIKKDLAGDHPDWENLYYDCGGASGVLISSAENAELKPFAGKTLDDVAKAWKKSPEDTLMDFVLADHAQTGAIYFMASEEDLRTGLSQLWTSIGLDASEMSLDGPLYEPHAHPRAMGSMPRFLGHFVRDEHLMPLEAAIRKITSLPAQREHLESRGLLKPGFFADITIFDPATIIDHATYTKPDQLSDGIDYTIVNGQIEYDHGKLTGATAGRVLRGRGWHPPAN